VTEADILELIAISTDRGFALLQWWVSITIGLAAVGHFAGRKLNRRMAAVLLALYAGYTFFIAVTAVLEVRFSETYYAALIELRDSGTHLSPAGVELIEENWGAMGVLALIALLVPAIVAFIATVVYVGHAAFRKEHRRM
jgi:hypothetical protein